MASEPAGHLQGFSGYGWVPPGAHRDIPQLNGMFIATRDLRDS